MRLFLTGAIFLLSFFVFAFTSWHWTLKRIPENVIEETRERFIDIAGGENTIYHLRRYGPGPGRIPRSNPDIMTSMCVYNTTNGPVEIGGDVWEEYWSISLYEGNGDNFYAINDEQVGQNHFHAVVDHRESDDRLSIKTPEPKGIMIVRRFVPEVHRAEPARKNQDSTYCRALDDR